MNLLSHPCVLILIQCTDIHSCGDDVDKDRPSGADCEHRQSAKTINAEPQKKLRQQKRMKKLTLKFRIAEQDSNVITHILQRNEEVEIILRANILCDSLSDATVQQFLGLTISQLKDFIHARKFNGRTFQESKLVGSAGNIKKHYTGPKQQTRLNLIVVQVALVLSG